MTDLCVIVPSRGRPQNIARLIQAWKDTNAVGMADLVVCIDNDDPKRKEYHEVCADLPWVWLWVDEPARLGPWLNRASKELVDDVAAYQYSMLGFLGDDHVFRTPDWVEQLIRARNQVGSGFFYGDDLVWGQQLPTAFFVTTDIVETLGYMMPPTLTHMFIDDWVRDVARAAGCLFYLPDLVIEHMHPIAQKAENDSGYDEVNEFMEPDKIAYEQYKADGSFDRDVEKLKALIGEK